jgi:hypothetical protein
MLRVPPDSCGRAASGIFNRARRLTPMVKRWRARSHRVAASVIQKGISSMSLRVLLAIPLAAFLVACDRYGTKPVDKLLSPVAPSASIAGTHRLWTDADRTTPGRVHRRAGATRFHRALELRPIRGCRTARADLRRDQQRWRNSYFHAGRGVRWGYRPSSKRARSCSDRGSRMQSDCPGRR